MARTGGAASWYSINPKVDMKISQNVCVNYFHDVSRKQVRLGSAKRISFAQAWGERRGAEWKSDEKAQIHRLASTEKTLGKSFFDEFFGFTG
jgi:hypothetical protein